MTGPFLTKAESRELVQIARDTIESYLRHGDIPSFQITTASLRLECGAFVSLTIGHDLRGCIGFVEGVEPLWKAVRDMVIAAATKDPRFESIRSEELPKLSIEISVLTPLEPVTDCEELTVGTHGLVIRQGAYSGLLLPQVATQYGWSVEQFLDQTCIKAGLEPGAWHDPEVSIFRFSAQILHETPSQSTG